MSPSRNDPCPCGSGRKYKHCHGGGRPAEASLPQDAAWRAVRRAIDGYPTALFRFVQDVYGPYAADEAWAEFTLWRDDDPEFDPETPHIELFIPWLFHHWAPDPAGTAVEDTSLHDRVPTAVYLERRGSRLNPVLARYLEGCLASAVSFHEILSCEPGRGFRTRDIMIGEEHEVLEGSASRTMAAGDLLFGQLVTSNGVTLLEACSAIVMPPLEKIGIIDLRERMRGGVQPPSRDTLRDWDIELRDAYLAIFDRLMNPSLPRLVNTEGEELAPHRLVFEISSARNAFHALKHLALDETESELLESAEHDEQGALRRVSIPWKTAGNPQHAGWDSTFLGNLAIEGDRLIAEVNSAGRAARLRAIVEETLGEGARHLSTEVESMESALARGRAAEASELPEAPSLADHPEVRQHLRALMMKHYESWVSEEIPALGGRTPLQAVQDGVGREKVEALIAQLEHPRPGGEPLDEAVTRMLRERLGFS